MILKLCILTPKSVFYWHFLSEGHSNCEDWCPSRTSQGDPNSNTFPKYVCDAIRPEFEVLTKDSLIEMCAHGGSQNTSESSHNVIWQRFPKSSFYDVFSIFMFWDSDVAVSVIILTIFIGFTWNFVTLSKDSTATVCFTVKHLCQVVSEFCSFKFLLNFEDA